MVNITSISRSNKFKKCNNKIADKISLKTTTIITIEILEMFLMLVMGCKIAQIRNIGTNKLTRWVQINSLQYRMIKIEAIKNNL